MSKRRINNQQSARIEKKQNQYRQQTDTGPNASTADGLVIKRFSRHALIEYEAGTRVHCSIRPNIDSLVAGDRCIWQTEGNGQGVVVSRYPRQSLLGRPDKRGHIKPVAANITQVMVVVAPKPEISWALLDSYLVMAEYLHLHICIVLNKIDLPCESIRQKLMEEYEHLGYSIIFTSVQDRKRDNHLQHALDGRTSV